MEELKTKWKKRPITLYLEEDDVSLIDRERKKLGLRSRNELACYILGKYFKDQSIEQEKEVEDTNGTGQSICDSEDGIANNEF